MLGMMTIMRQEMKEMYACICKGNKYEDNDAKSSPKRGRFMHRHSNCTFWQVQGGKPEARINIPVSDKDTN